MFYINWKNKWKSFYRSNALIQKVRKNFLKNNDDLFNTRTRETNLKFIILFALKNCLLGVLNQFNYYFGNYWSFQRNIKFNGFE
jgi:hypothetical protein